MDVVFTGLGSQRMVRIRGNRLWDTLEKAYTFFERWDIEEEPGEIAARLLDDVGLVPEP